jgi:hypothetical protein
MIRRILWDIAGAAVLFGVPFAILALPSAAQTVITRDLGGSVHQYAQRVAEYRTVRHEVAVTGLCASACTMFLALPDTCTTRSAAWGFHGASGHPLAAEIGNAVLMAHYPARVLRALPADWTTLTGASLYWYSGEQLIGMGVKECQQWQ